MNAEKKSSKLFPSHLDFWYAREEARNPGWRDDVFLTSAGRPLGSAPRSPATTAVIKRRWEELRIEMMGNGVPIEVSAGKLRSIHLAGRSVIASSEGRYVGRDAAPSERIVAHVARLKTSSPQWQRIAYAWIAPSQYRSLRTRDLLAKLIEGTPPSISLVAFTGSGWLTPTLVECGFRAISPHDPMLPPLQKPDACACYVLHR